MSKKTVANVKKKKKPWGEAKAIQMRSIANIEWITLSEQRWCYRLIADNKIMTIWLQKDVTESIWCLGHDH